MRREHAFTLVELLIVVVILGILASITALALGNMTQNGRARSCQAEVRSVNAALQGYYPRQNPPAFPATTSVNAMFATLHAAQLLTQTGAQATATFGPTYDGAGHFSASCPA